jgi:poly-gamma-glutamate synthesis protein (capsule biosynthesis protein)
MVLRARPDAIATLIEAGVDVVSLANNHSLDCGLRGLAFTRTELARADIAAVGAGEDFATAHCGAVLERNELRVGFLAYTYADTNDHLGATGAVVAGMNREQLRVDILALRARSDVVVVSLHAGAEYSPHAGREQQEFARAAIDAGARLVVGHHPHVVQPPEAYHGGWIFYSLGNLVFDQPWPETQAGWLLRAKIIGRKLMEAESLPIQIENLCCPRLLDPTPEASREK